MTATLVPMWHDSEVAAMAYAIQNIPARRVADPAQQQLPLDEPTPPPVAVPQAMAARSAASAVPMRSSARRLRPLHAVAPGSVIYRGAPRPVPCALR